MPIRIREPLEPLSEVALADIETESLLARSAASLLLAQEMARYCRREVNGRSFLISGHRGAGKTTLVTDAFGDVRRASLRGSWPSEAGERDWARPLLVMLHGPNLFPEFQMSEASAAAAADSGQPQASRARDRAGNRAPAKTAPQVALEQIILCLHRAVVREVAREYRRSVLRPVLTPGESGEVYVSRMAGADRWVASRQGGPPGRPPVFVPRRPADAWVERYHDRLEMAAQLENELLESPSPARLRELWERGTFLASGVLFGDPDARYDDQGLRELVAVAGVCEAYRRISGRYQLEEKVTDAAARKLEASLGGTLGGRELFGPVLSLLSGGLVGAGLTAARTPGIEATLAGIAAALGAAAVLKVSSSRSRASSMTREATFLFDLSTATLDRALPILIDRLLAAGLAPIFVVDELDKVEDLSQRILGMVHHLKKLVAEQAFFCFLTDRSYYEQMVRRSEDQPYPVEYTYFTHCLFVAFQPADLHLYLSRALELLGPDLQAGAGAEDAAAVSQGGGSAAAGVAGDSSLSGVAGGAGRAAAGHASADARLLELEQKKAIAPDEDDYAMLPWVLLHRSQMHALDLARRLAELRNDNGNLCLPSGTVASGYAYRFDAMIQIAVEIILDDPDLRNRLEREPEFGRLTFDTMYYLSRRWLADPSAIIDLEEGTRHAFADYLGKRMGKEKVPRRQAVPSPEARPARGRSASRRDAGGVEPEDGGDAAWAASHQEDLGFLFQRVRELAGLLSDFKHFGDRFELWNRTRARPVEISVLEALHLEKGDTLLVRNGKTDRFQWRYDPSGRQLIEAPAAGGFAAAGGAVAGAEVFLAGALAAAVPLADHDGGGQVLAATPEEWRDDAGFIIDFADALAELTR